MQNATQLTPKPPRKTRSSREVRILEKQRSSWYERLEPTALFQRLFDHLPGVSFFAKDEHGRTMFASQSILERYGMSDELEMLGLTDFDINPERMAADYVKDDQQLMSSKVKQIERVELWFDRQGMPDWYFVVKLPLLDKRGKPVGIMGVLRRAEEHEMRLPIFQTVAGAVEMIRRDFALSLPLQDVASQCGQSLRNLQRGFIRAFGISPQEFRLKTRILAAMRMLRETNLNVSEIAQRCGFTDASGFIAHFRRRTGMTPGQYRADL